MTRTVMFSVTALILTTGACSKGAPCEELATRLCDASSEHCDAARPWLAEQGAGDTAARDAACAAVLGDQTATAAYIARFATAMAPKPAAVTPSAPRSVAPSAGAGNAPSRPATTKDKVREAGETIEEVGTAAEKAGEALDKLRGALGDDAR